MNFSKIHKSFFIALLVFLPTQLAMHFWPNWSLVLGRRIDFIAPTLYLTDILLFFVLFFWLADKYKNIFDKPFVFKSNYKYVLLVVVFATLNICIASRFEIALFKWLKVLEFSLFAFYVWKNKPSIFVICFSLLIAMLCSAMIAIFQFGLQTSIGGIFWWLGERTFDVDTPGIARIYFPIVPLHGSELLLRAYATFPHPNVLAGFIVVLLPIILINLLKINISKYLLLVVLVICLSALMFTFSRGPILLITIFFGILLLKYFLNIKKLNNKYYYYLFFIVSVCLGVILLFQSNEESIIIRNELNNSAIKIWLQSTIFGTGLGNFLVRLPEVADNRTTNFLQPVHNIFLLLLSEVGIVGLGLFMLVIYQCLKEINFQVINFKFSILLLLILGLIDHYPLTLQQGQLLLFLILPLALRNK